MGSVVSDARPTSGGSKLAWKSYVALFVIAAALRVGWVLYRCVTDQAGSLEFPDETLYWSLGESLAHEGEYVDAQGAQVSHMPLYPAFLSLFVAAGASFDAARVAQAVLSALVAPIAAASGQNVGSSTTGWIAGLLVAIDPFFVFFSQLLLTESLFIVVLSAMWYAGLRLSEGELNRPTFWLALFAVSFVVAVYLRPSAAGILLFWVPVAIVRSADPSRPMLGLFGAFGLLVLALLPWASRNDRVVGRPVWLTLRSGISLYDGLGPQATGASDLARAKTLPEVAERDEVERNSHYTRLALRAAIQDPARTLNLAAVKLARTWSLFPHAAGYRSGLLSAVSAAWMIGIYAMLVLGLLHLRGRPAIGCLLLVPAVYFSLVHMLFVGSVRYRLGAMPMIEVLAAVGAAALVRRFAGKPFGRPEISADGISDSLPDQDHS